MRNMIFILCFLMSLSTFSYAQQTEKGNGSTNSALPENSQRDLIQEFVGSRHSESVVPEKDKNRHILETPGSESLLNKEYEYEISAYKHRRKIFDWQLTSSKILFWTVIIIVFIGLFFSGLQFYISLKRQNEKQHPSLKNDHNRAEGKTTFEATLKGVKVSSSVLGVIILVISLCFFYLYLVYVYPINEIVTKTQTEASIDR